MQRVMISSMEPSFPKLFIALSLLIPFPVNAATILWQGFTNPTTPARWGDSANWSPNTVPTTNDIARFAVASPLLGSTAVSVADAMYNVGEIYFFNVGVAPYTFTLSGVGNGLTLTGLGITGASSSDVRNQIFNITNNASLIMSNSADLGNIQVNTSAGGILAFTGSGTAGTAKITNNGIIDVSGLTAGNSITLGNYAGSGNIQLGANKVVFTAQSGATTVSGVISGTGAIDINSPTHTLTFSGANTYTGLTTVIDALNFNLTGSIAGDLLVTDGTVTVGAGGSFAGTLTNNSATGSVTLNNALASQTINNNALLLLGNTFGGNNATINNNSGGEIDVNGTADVGDSTIINTGASEIFFNGSVDAAFATIVNDSTSLEGVDISSFTPASFTLGSLSGSGNFFLGSKNLFVNSLLTGSDVNNISGVISGTGSVTFQGNGTTVLSGANTYTGNTTISTGTVNVSGSLVSSNVTTVASTGNFIINGSVGTSVVNNGTTTVNTALGTTGITNNTTGQLNFTGNSDASNSVITSSGAMSIAGLTASSVSIGDYSGSGTINLGAKTLNLNANVAGTHTVSGVISGNGGSLVKQGSGTLNLTAANTYTGNTVVQAGTLNLSGSVAGGILVSDGFLIVTPSGSFAGTLTNNSLTGNVSLFNVLTNQHIINASLLNFESGSSAGSSIIANNTGGTIDFLSGSTAGSSTITNSGTSKIVFLGNSTANNATIVNNATGTGVDISGVTTALTIGSLSGSGDVNLGTKNLSLNGLLTASNTNTISGNIMGSGMVTFQGNGTTVLSGANTYTGNTSVASGTVNVQGSLAASNITTVSTPGTLIINGSVGTSVINNGTTIVNTLLGTTGITNNATGQLNFTGNSDASNSVITSSGAMSIAGITGSTLNIGNYSGSGTINLGAKTLNLNANMAGTNTVSGVISGTGSLVKQGTGTLILSGANLYTGTTFIQNGTLNLTGSLKSMTEVESGAIFDIAAIGSTTGGILIDAGGTANISGSVGPFITNNGLLNFLGTSNAASTAIINNGTLDVNVASLSIGSLSGASTGMIDLFGNTVTVGALNTNTTYLGNVTGPGAFNKTGTGSFTFDGIADPAVTTLISAGTLIAGDISHPGALLGDVTIGSAGTLIGYGGAHSLINNGVFMPGAGGALPAANFMITTDYHQATNGLYVVNIDAAGNANKITVGGTAYLNDGLLDVNTFGNLLSFNRDLVIVEAGHVNGVFTLESTPTFLEQTLTYTPTEVLFRWTYNSNAILAAALTPNELAVAENILLTGATNSINYAIEFMETPEQMTDFLNQLSAATYANQMVTLAQLDRKFQDELAQRIDAYQTCVTAGIRKFKTKKIENVLCNDRVFWFNAYAGSDKISEAAQISGLNTNTLGLNMGGETPFGNGSTVIGFGLGFVDYRGDTAGIESGSYTGDLYQFALYLRQQIALNWRAGFSLGYSLANNNSGDREITTAINGRMITSEYSTNVFDAQGRISYRYFSNQGFDLQPIVGVIYQRVNGSSFTEDGVPGFSLNVKTQDFSSLRSQLGLEADFVLNYRNLDPFVYVAWEREFKNQTAQFQANFVGDPLPFDIVGVDIGKNFFVLQAGVAHIQQRNWELSLSYQGRYASNFSENLLVAQLGYF